MISHWQRTSFHRTYDLAVIGAGIVGLHAALYYKRQNPTHSVCVIERGIYPSGASVKNAGFACFGSPSEIISDIRMEGTERAIARVEMRWRGLAGLRQELGDDNIGFIQHGGYELFKVSDSLYTDTMERIDELNDLLSEIMGSETYHPADDILPEMGFKGLGHAIRIHGEASIDTGKMMQALWNKVMVEGIQLIQNTKIREVDHHGPSAELRSEAGSSIRSAQVIVATNGYTSELNLDLPVVPGRGQVVMTSPIADLRIRGNHHLEEGYYYFRPVGNRILLGGGRNLDPIAEQTNEEGLTSIVQEKLETLLREVILPDTDFSIDQRWSGIMGFGPTKEPIVERLNDRIVVAVRLAGMGVAIGHTLGKHAADLASQ